MGPVQKSKDKTKGAHKLKSNDVVSSHRLITWRVVDGRPGLNFSGLSATGMLVHLGYDSNDIEESHGNEYDTYYDDVPQVGADIDKADVGCDDQAFRISGNDNDDDNMSFLDVGMVLNQVEEDEGWYLVGEHVTDWKIPDHPGENNANMVVLIS